MAARARRTLTLRPTSELFNALECCTVVGFNVSPRGLEHLPARNNDDIYTGQWFVDFKKLSNQPFRPISGDRVSNFLTGGDTEPR